MLETIRKLPPASSITPTFDHMAVDTSWERKVLKKVTWLQIPGKCSLTDRDVLLITTIYVLLLELRLHLILWWKPEYNFWKKFIISRAYINVIWTSFISAQNDKFPCNLNKYEWDTEILKNVKNELNLNPRKLVEKTSMVFW